MKTIVNFLVLMCSFLFPFGEINSVNAQEMLSGKVLDAADDSPLVYANIYLNSDPSRGTFSNADGIFEMNILTSDLIDTLVISQIGYKTLKIPLQEVNFGETTTYRIESSLTELATITVVSDEGLRGIVREAIRRIPQNYGSKKHYLRAYYREYSISDGQYAEQIEAILQIRDNAYKDPEKFSKIYLKEFRRSNDQRNLPDRLAKSFTNPFYNLYERFNPIRKRQFHLFAPNPNVFLKRFRFFNLGESLDANLDTLITIGYEMKNNLQGKDGGAIQFFRGQLTVNKKDFGILSVKQGGDSKESYREAIYQKTGGKYYPVSLLTAYSFRYENLTRSYFNTKMIRFFDLKQKKRFKGKKGKRMDRDENIRKMKYKYNEAFWKNNPVIKEVPAPKALEADLSKVKRLEDQFKENARKKG